MKLVFNYLIIPVRVQQHILGKASMLSALLDYLTTNHPKIRKFPIAMFESFQPFINNYQ